MAKSFAAGKQSKASRSGSDQAGFTLANFKWPLGLAVAILLISTTPRVQGNGVLVASFYVAAALLFVWAAIQMWQMQRQQVSRGFFILLRPQHYVQAMVQISVYSYWGYYWRPVYDHFWLILAQIFFAYGFDMLLSWSRRRDYTLGFGPVPIILSVNLFLWFRDDWFYLQFHDDRYRIHGQGICAMAARRQKRTYLQSLSFCNGHFFSYSDYHQHHQPDLGPGDCLHADHWRPIFTPSSFWLALSSCISSPITLVAGMAAVTLFLFQCTLLNSDRCPLFIDSEIPAAVFLGLHLLITDPSTSPRTLWVNCYMNFVWHRRFCALHDSRRFRCSDFLRQAVVRTLAESERYRYRQSSTLG